MGGGVDLIHRLRLFNFTILHTKFAILLNRFLTTNLQCHRSFIYCYNTPMCSIIDMKVICILSDVLFNDLCFIEIFFFFYSPVSPAKDVTRYKRQFSNNNNGIIACNFKILHEIKMCNFFFFFGKKLRETNNPNFKDWVVRLIKILSSRDSWLISPQ